MGKGPSESVSYAQGVPKGMTREHRALIDRAEALVYGRGSDQAMQPYNFPQDARMADFDPFQKAGFQARRDLYEGGDPYADYAGHQLAAAGSIPGQFEDIRSYYGPRQFNAGVFNEAAQRQYMSPYIQNVLQGQLKAAQDEYAGQQNRTAAQNVAAGALGGYRDAVQAAQGASLQGQVMSDITGKGLQSAYENAQMQFERDRAAKRYAAEMGDTSAYRAAQMRMDADLQNQKRQQWEGGFSADLARQAMDMGNVGQQRALQRIKEMEHAGAMKSAKDQARRDLAYSEGYKRHNWSKDQINWMASLLSGVPYGTKETMSTPGPNQWAQLAGLGMTGAGVYDLATR